MVFVGVWGFAVQVDETPRFKALQRGRTWYTRGDCPCSHKEAARPLQAGGNTLLVRIRLSALQPCGALHGPDQGRTVRSLDKDTQHRVQKKKVYGVDADRLSPCSESPTGGRFSAGGNVSVGVRSPEQTCGLRKGRYSSNDRSNAPPNFRVTRVKLVAKL